MVLSAKASNSSHARMRADALAVPLREDTTIVRKMRVPSSTDFPEVGEAWCWQFGMSIKSGKRSLSDLELGRGALLGSFPFSWPKKYEILSKSL